MKILFVAPYPPSRIRIRSYGFVCEMAKQHDITVLALCSNQRERQDAQMLHEQGIKVVTIHDIRLAKIVRVFQALFTRIPLQVAFDASPRLRATLCQQLATGHFDLVHVEFIRALGAVPEKLPVPLVWDAVDCISLLYEQGGHSGATSLLRSLGTFEARRVRAYEHKRLSCLQQVLVTSQRDREALLNIAAEPSADPSEKRRSALITVLPHGIDRDYFKPSQAERYPETLIFSGKMSFHANIAAALILIKEIMPLVWQKRPGVRLIIAGSNPPAKIYRLARSPLIEVTGYMPDLRPSIEQAQIAVCPLPYAVGIQNKILEAMALGTPVIASPQAAAGLQVTTNHELLIADSPQAFAEAVLRLLADQQLWTKLATTGQEYIARFHNWQQISQQLNNIYTDLVTQKQPETPLISSK